MKIKRLVIKNFKRFSDLTIEGIPESARLVVLVGPNGSGKSSLFDLFNVFLAISKRTGIHFDADYYPKFKGAYTPSPEQPLPPLTDAHGVLRNGMVEFHDAPPFDNGNHPRHGKKTFYVRSGYRNEADFTLSSMSRMDDVLLDTRRPTMLIQQDTRVSDNYQRIVSATVDEVFKRDGDDSKTRKQIRESILGEVRESLLRVFDNGLELIGPGDPLQDGTFFFQKGATSGWRFKNLSAGEKSAFDLLLDFMVKRAKFDDTVYCIDEPELHMHSELQARLLNELYRQLPQKCQLWIATHSIGMVRAAKTLHEQNPGSVAFLDFAGQDFDTSVVLPPAQTNRNFWKKTFRVAIGDLVALVAPSRLVICEGRRKSEPGKKAGEFDARVYRAIFASEFPDTEFIALGSANEVERDSVLLASALQQMLDGLQVVRVIDRDDRSASDIEPLTKQGFRVLSRRHIESYLYDDEVLAALCDSVGQCARFPEVQAQRDALLAASSTRGNPTDDIKSIAGEMYTWLKKALSLTKCGNTAESFAIDTLAPLIRPTMNVYSALRSDIFGP